MNDLERARIRMLDIDHRRMNRALWRKHPVFALRFALAGHLTVENFWLPVASSIGQCMGYGAGAMWATTCAGSRSRTIQGGVA